ncbi:MAG: redoxin domain-containing protein [Caldilineaceae bacterium]|nr:redoxin domain-containing protein [Caldilineaceae bacterium]
MNRWGAVFVILLVLGTGWIWVSRLPAEAQSVQRNAEPAIGHPAPDFALETLNGENFSLAEHRGTPVVLNFWATWCGPCQRELPSLQAASERYAGQVVIVGVDQSEPAETVQRYVDELALTFAIPMDTDNEVAHRYNVVGMPTTFFIDADGIIRSTWTGEMNSVTLAEGISTIFP